LENRLLTLTPNPTPSILFSVCGDNFLLWGNQGGGVGWVGKQHDAWVVTSFQKKTQTQQQQNLDEAKLSKPSVIPRIHVISRLKLWIAVKVS